ncbi:hypothetical protein RJ641_026787 [Dillenia turbinata]|uniref:Uncharacterized protein n=1 Tax=Dillenia turbinata TaxID=194707 RepID=A0AAN8VX06_9MAGN
MRAKIDPSLDLIWFYTAATLRDRDFKEGENLKRFQSLKELFDLIVSCSASSSGLKSIALVSPVAFHAYNLLANVLKRELSDEIEQKSLRDVKLLVDSILGYFSVCCTSLKNSSEESECVGLIWQTTEHGVGERFEALGSWIDKWVSEFIMFGTLLKIMLERVLPVSSLLSSDEEVLLKKVRFDAVIMVEYSFLDTSRLLQQSVELMKMIAMARLIVTNNAIELFRRDGDQKRTLLYKRFLYFSFFFPNHQFDQQSYRYRGEKEQTKRIIAKSFSSVFTSLGWVLNLEDRGIKVFEVISNYRANILWDCSSGDNEQSVNMVDDKQLYADLLFFIDNKGEEKDKNEDDMEEEDIDKIENVNDSICNAFITTARTMNSTENNLTRKCGEGKGAEKMKTIKFVKYDLPKNANVESENSMLVDDGSGSESDVENLSSDEDMDAKN